MIHTTPMDSPSSSSIERLAQLADEIGDLQSKLILLVGRSGKTKLLHMLAQRLNTPLFNIGVKLGRGLAAIPLSERSFSTNELLREITDSACGDVLLLLDNLEVLFEPSLKINPLDIIKRLAHSRRVVAVWPGEMRNDRLMYAGMGHPEHRDCTRDGVVVFELAQSQ